MKRFKKTPEFKNVAEENAFWQKHDSTDYIDWSKAGKARFAKLKNKNSQTK